MEAVTEQVMDRYPKCGNELGLSPPGRVAHNADASERVGHEVASLAARSGQLMADLSVSDGANHQKTRGGDESVDQSRATDDIETYRPPTSVYGPGSTFIPAPVPAGYDDNGNMQFV